MDTKHVLNQAESSPGGEATFSNVQTYSMGPVADALLQPPPSHKTEIREPVTKRKNATMKTAKYPKVNLKTLNPITHNLKNPG